MTWRAIRLQLRALQRLVPRWLRSLVRLVRPVLRVRSASRARLVRWRVLPQLRRLHLAKATMVGMNMDRCSGRVNLPGS